MTWSHFFYIVRSWTYDIYFQDQKAYAILESAVKQGPATDSTVVLVCGPDVVNYSTFLLLAEDPDTAEVGRSYNAFPSTDVLFIVY